MCALINLYEFSPVTPSIVSLFQLTSRLGHLEGKQEFPPTLTASELFPEQFKSMTGFQKTSVHILLSTGVQVVYVVEVSLGSSEKPGILVGYVFIWEKIIKETEGRRLGLGCGNISECYESRIYLLCQ